MSRAGPADQSTSLARGVLGVPGIVFLVLAAVAPLTGMVVIAAVGIAVGNGGGMVASFVAATVVALGYWAAGLDPIAALTASMTGFGTLGILTLQLLAAIAIVVHFRRAGDTRLWRTLVAPGLGGLGLLAVVSLAVLNFPALAGSDNPVIARLPWVLLLVLLAGPIMAAWLRRARPAVYRNLRTDLERAPAHH